jgi:hypothetical protein
MRLILKCAGFSPVCANRGATAGGFFSDLRLFAPARPNSTVDRL